ncbi:hypothetical protein CARUB_v10021872mg [Capsella rubella]|uniref:SIAH-type domain-containing protein n=1 Tax=Capsella rubella TaxID=81985 RepID=R0ICH1_9BRAS|nr:hypothetical protein CARUB_v10021872mg [Capsella rubella]
MDDFGEIAELGSFHLLRLCVGLCDDGHIACSSCCTKLRKKCPSGALPIGNYRSRIMERVVEAVFVPCSNAKHGCTEKFSYGKELRRASFHEKECIFTSFYCPTPDCNYSGMYKELYSHYKANHQSGCGDEHFRSGHDEFAWTLEKIIVLKERRDGPLVVIQVFEKPGSREGDYWTRGSDKMNRIQKVSFQSPEKCFITVPMTNLKMKFCITQRNE